ncbi:MAG: hypothetical protein ACI8U1_002717 [Rheinheimera aquimaris]|jgi:hypothetical protein
MMTLWATFNVNTQANSALLQCLKHRHQTHWKQPEINKEN